MHCRPTSWFPLLLATLAGCASPEPAASWPVGERPPLRARDFPAPPELLRGFDPRAADDAWRSGDEALLGLRLRKGEGERHWLLRLRLLDPVVTDAEGADRSVEWQLKLNGRASQFRSRLCRAEVVVMDQRGAVLGRSEPLLPRDLLAHGVASACAQTATAREAGLRRLVEAGDGSALAAHFETLGRASVCAIALLQVVQEDDVLAPLLWEVVEKPSLLSVVANMGVSVTLRPEFGRSAATTSPLVGNDDPTWSLPLVLDVNEQSALLLELLVADPSPPFALCGGLFGATARHPRDPGVEFSMLLLSARCGR